MLTYEELIELKDKLINNEIGVKSAKDKFWKDFKEGRRSWHSKDWKERRLKFLKDKCQICNSKQTLTLQHLSHPKKHNEYLREVTRDFTNQFINKNSVIDRNEFKKYILENYDYFPVPLCPSCGNKNPKKRIRKEPKYRCGDCKYEFNEVNSRSFEELISVFFDNEDAYEIRDKCFTSKNEYKNKHSLSNIKYYYQRNIAKNNNTQSIEKKAFLLYLEDNIKYLSFDDTITACKKCASSYDLHRMDLCPKCKENYKGIQYPTCIRCLPEKRRKVIEEQIEFGKQLREMEKRLGID